ncbi:DUF2278 family protein [Nonomuraea helvata]|uniref:DUF2278 family protein n=1 Tax=Nonomuraea helvata TaxID=37484 RepID=A0ABV5S3D7_9ACTN
MPGADNDLADRLDHFVQRAISDPDAQVFVFGERWGPEPSAPDRSSGADQANREGWTIVF